ncbi:hypothetical protein ABI59_03160 [Acidobacteria bacterium Mor1]|nr:hypothetical protein ABI59_03160 [Acidobacteria bacterium Mor1]
MSERLEGLGVSAGVAVGTAVLLHAQTVPVVPKPVPPERVADEIQRFHDARAQARKEIESLRERVRDQLGEQYAGILDAQLLIVDDRRLVSLTAQKIRIGRVSAGWALSEVSGEFLRAFDQVEDEYIRERGGELRDVQQRLLRILGGNQTPKTEMRDGPKVIVAHNLGPTDAIALAQQNVVGLATDVGGRTSHMAILAQALSLPAVIGLHDASSRVQDGDPLILDGDRGHLVLDPEPAEVDSARERIDAHLARETAMVAASGLPAITRDGVEVVLRANIEFPEEMRMAQRFGAQGIGLYRSEFLFLSRAPELPTEEEHYQTYLSIGQACDPHPAIIRSLDLGGEKYFHEVLAQSEPNPVLGLRAIRLCLKRPDIFLPQLRGFLRAAAECRLQLMIPLVTRAEEITAVRQLLKEQAEILRAEGKAANPDVPLGIMIEVPAAALAADIFGQEADFFSIGTNDLIQYALAVDRGNESVSRLYEPLHPAVIRMIRMVVESADRNGIPVSLCGEMAADPRYAGLLVGLGLRELSIQPRSLGPVRQRIRELDGDHLRRIAADAGKCGSASEVESLLAHELAADAPEPVDEDPAMDRNAG